MKKKPKHTAIPLTDPFDGEEFEDMTDIDTMHDAWRKAMAYFGKARAFMEAVKKIATEHHAKFDDDANLCRSVTSSGKRIRFERPDIKWDGTQLRELYEEFQSLPITRDIIKVAGYRVSLTQYKTLRDAKAKGESAKFLTKLEQANLGRPGSVSIHLEDKDVPDSTQANG